MGWFGGQGAAHKGHHLGSVKANTTARRRMCRSLHSSDAVPTRNRVGGPLARVGRPKLSSRTGGDRHRGPAAAAVVACAAPATNMPNSLREFRPSVEEYS